MKKQVLAGIAIALTLASCKKDEPYVANNSNSSSTGEEVTNNASAQEKLIEELRTYAPTAETKTADVKKIIEFTTEEGNVITFPSNAFVDASGNPITGNVDISVTEINDVSEMILSGMMTNSDQGPLSSQGEFNIEVTKDGEEVFLDEGKNITIENTSAEPDTAMIGWTWIPDGEEGSSTTDGEWTRNEFEENNPCKRYKALWRDLFTTEAGDPAVIWPKISEFKNFIFTELGKEIDISNEKILVNDNIYDWDSSVWLSYEFTNFTDQWSLNKSSEFYIVATGDKADSGIFDATGYDTQIYLTKDSACAVFHPSTGYIDLNPFAIQITFSELGWCNLDRLFAEYGFIENCKLNANIPDYADVKCVFLSENGAVSMGSHADNEFTVKNLPDGYETTFLVYFKDGDKIKFGTQKITIAEEMEFDTSNLITLNNVDELADEIKKLVE